jgi:CRP-like cAMP-binding protein
MPTAHITDISTLPLFDRITPADCTLLFDCLGCRIRRYAKDEHIRLERELDGNVGTILEGTVHLYKEDVWGSRALIAYLKEGDLFGETFVFTGQSPDRDGVSYIAASSALILFLPGSRILHPCKNSCPFHHSLAQNMFSMIADKNRRLMQKIEATSRGSVRDKILTFLSMEARRQGSASFRLPLNRTEMAEYLCINRSAMTRELSALKKEGLIDIDRDRFTLYSADFEAEPM